MPELVTRLPAPVSVRLQVSVRALPAAAVIGGLALPRQPNTWAGADPIIWWVSPDAWLIQSAREGDDLAAQLRSDCMNLPCAVTDLSDALVTFALEGPDASAVLARGCGLDLRAGSFGARACARTRLAQLPVLIRKTGSTRFELVVDLAAAQYLQDWLLDAAAGVG
ncbi:MAG: sarcosine oxidase, gamma subunit [Steroidobacteraceae bacterium]|nr:sarcosine oxidase, gamma subunit [Steroidobacteraceae bacterium]